MAQYEFKCSQCGKTCWRDVNDCAKYKNNWSGKNFCSLKCYGAHKTKHSTVIAECANCGKPLQKLLKDLKKSYSGRLFCNRSCSITYNNRIKRKSRRSKCEKLLFDLLVEEFPQLSIKCNDKDMLGGLEVDIAIPSLKLAIEWNGIVHFKPIYGQDKLNRIQEIDKTKQEIALRNDINLIVIPDLVSKKEYVLEVFEKIKNIINELTAL